MSAIQNVRRVGGYLLNSATKSKGQVASSTSCSHLYVIHKICYPVLKCNWDSYRFSYTFLSRVSADQLWKGVTSVSAAGRKKGRGKRVGRRIIQDLNKGQVIGFGKKNMLWPGLTSPVIRGKEVIAQQELPPDDSRHQRIIEMRDQVGVHKRLKLTPLERGWSGTKLPGRSVGPPDPVGEDTFEGFDSRVLQFRGVMKMSGQRGRIRSLNAFVVVGNKNGLAGFARSTSSNGMVAVNNAKNKAGQALRYIERYREHTVLHDFFTQFGANRIFVFKKPEGYGLVCHRALRAICQMIGIKDMYAKCEGPTDNIQNLTKAFFIGLMRQKLPEEIAEDKKLHVVEIRKDRDNFPQVIASPIACRKEDEIDVHESMDFRLYCFQGRVSEPPKPFEPYYAKFPKHLEALKSREKERNHHQVMIQLVSKYGSMKSFLTVREEEKAKQAIKENVES